MIPLLLVFLTSFCVTTPVAVVRATTLVASVLFLLLLFLTSFGITIRVAIFYTNTSVIHHFIDTPVANILN
jgi:hypothetical protein